MDILIYHGLDSSAVRKPYEKVLALLQQDDFYSADVKKLTGTPYYRAKLTDAHRLLFKLVTYKHKKYLLILEVIYNHAYEKSRFLKGARIEESKLEVMDKASGSQHTIEPIPYLNPACPHFHVLDKIISFDATQEAIFNQHPPLIIIGSAGSGKTMLTLEKMKTCLGDILYVTGSPYLVQNARQLYYANHYFNDDQAIEFLTYRELLETIQVPEGNEIDFQRFSRWLTSNHQTRPFQDANKLYEEFKGVITGNTITQPYLSYTEYSQLGIKQSIYSVAERSHVYRLFEKYLAFLRENQLYDTNLVSFDYLAHCEARYDFIVVDEVQDFTPIQLALLLKLLKTKQHFILCGDANQIVHPNFFSWAKIKSLFYHQATPYPVDIIRLLNQNYRNAPTVTALANQLLKIKQARFGSIDKESHYLIESQSETQGDVYCLVDSAAIRAEINHKTHKSTRFAVIVLQEALKEQASQYFQTPLIFSIQEAKGLEYDNVILYNFISSEEKRFWEIAQGVNVSDLAGEFVYRRAKDKADRSLEIYKFFVNALYVAITRAIKNVYLLEKNAQHPLFNLLNLRPTAEFAPIERQESSLEEWQKEAGRLDMQGKQAQAKAIRNTLLHTQPVPWHPLTVASLAPLREKALQQANKDKEARLQLFEYALHYQQSDLLAELAAIGFAPALKPKKDYTLLERKYFMGYASQHTTSVLQQVSLYGVDFRNRFNQTPLMLACHFGNHTLVRQLIEKGANPHLTDNLGRTAFQIALQKALVDKHFAQAKLVPLYQCLSPDAISVNIENRLIKLDAARMEFFLVNAMIALAHQKLQKNLQSLAFNVNDFLLPLIHFPDIILPERYKRRAYLSSLLARHEIHRCDKYNKKLFLRVKHGYYSLNPAILIKAEEGWINIYTLLNLKPLERVTEKLFKVSNLLTEDA